MQRGDQAVEPSLILAGFNVVTVEYCHLSALQFAGHLASAFGPKRPVGYDCWLSDKT